MISGVGHRLSTTYVSQIYQHSRTARLALAHDSGMASPPVCVTTINIHGWSRHNESSEETDSMNHQCPRRVACRLGDGHKRKRKRRRVGGCIEYRSCGLLIYFRAILRSLAMAPFLVKLRSWLGISLIAARSDNADYDDSPDHLSLFPRFHGLNRQPSANQSA